MSIPAQQYRNVQWREGTNKPLSSRFAALRVRPAHGDNAQTALRDEEWLLIEWPAGENEPSKYWLSTLPADTTLERLVYVAKMRWRIEYAGNPTYQYSNPPISENFDGLSLNAVGSGTTIEYVQVYKSGDDGIKIKGGTVNLRYILLNNNQSDQIEAKGAWRGSIQYAILIPGNVGANNNGISLEEQARMVITNTTILGNAQDEIMKIKTGGVLQMTNSYIANFTNREIAMTNAATLDLIDTGDTYIRATLLERMSNSGDTYHRKGRVLLGESLDGVNDALIGSDYRCDVGDPGYDATNKRCDVPAEADLLSRYLGSGNLTLGDNRQQNPVNCVYLGNDCSGLTLVPATPEAGQSIAGNGFIEPDARIGGAFSAWFAGWARRTDSALY